MGAPAPPEGGLAGHGREVRLKRAEGDVEPNQNQAEKAEGFNNEDSGGRGGAGVNDCVILDFRSCRFLWWDKRPLQGVLQTAAPLRAQ